MEVGSKGKSIAGANYNKLVNLAKGQKWLRLTSLLIKKDLCLTACLYTSYLITPDSGHLLPECHQGVTGNLFPVLLDFFLSIDLPLCQKL